MKLLGFADNAKVPRHYFMEGVDMIVAIAGNVIINAIMNVN